MDFNPRSPHRERLFIQGISTLSFQFQSTLPSQGATLACISLFQTVVISIHAPLTGSDSAAVSYGHPHPDFNPRSPHRERHNSGECVSGNVAISIHAPLTGSDAEMELSGATIRISIHAPLTGSDPSSKKDCAYIFISIHAPLTGSDQLHMPRMLIQIPFQSTLPSQGATISTTTSFPSSYYFNPRSPHRERLCIIAIIKRRRIFQSTLPSQGATI